MSCKGYYIADFASYLVVKNTMNVNNLAIDDIPLSIAVNTDKLHAYIERSDYCPIGGIEVTDPCDPTQTITVPCVTLTELRITGAIGYIIGAGVLQPTPAPTVEIEPDGVSVLSMATVDGVTLINDEVINILDDPNATEPDLKVIVQRIEVVHAGVNDNDDHIYFIDGEFKIEPINESSV